MTDNMGAKVETMVGNIDTICIVYCLCVKCHGVLQFLVVLCLVCGVSYM